MRRSSSQAPKSNSTPKKFLCLHVDKTIPDLADRIRKNSSPSTPETHSIETMR